MLTEKDYCDYDTCVTLKELGFDYNVDWYFYPPSYKEEEQEGCLLCWGIPPMISEEQEQEYIPRVSLYEAQKWLREEEDIHITINYICLDEDIFMYTLRHIGKKLRESGGLYNNKQYSSCEEALSEGIKEAVRILKEN